MEIAFTISTGFLIGQIITFIIFMIGWYIAHIRLKDKVHDLKESCKICKANVDEKFIAFERDTNLDLDEIKNDVKTLTISFNDFKLQFIEQITALKTSLSKHHYD